MVHAGRRRLTKWGCGMSEDVREAAERLRRLKTCKETSQGMYGVEFDRYDQGSVIEAGNRVKYLILQDEKSVIDVYLSEHPADESIEVDAEWLVQIGFEPDASGALWIGDRRLCWDRRICWFGNGYFGFDGVELDAKTRGDVRRMLKVFGVEIKE